MGVRSFLRHALPDLPVAVSLAALTAVALPAVGVLVILTLAGVRVGYRQDKADFALRTAGIARFARRRAGGWHPDPNGLPAQRYFDGTAWAENLAPLPVAAPVGGGRTGPNNLLHLVLTLLTGGLWLPVWIVLAMRDALKGKGTTAITGGSP